LQGAELRGELERQLARRERLDLIGAVVVARGVGTIFSSATAASRRAGAPCGLNTPIFKMPTRWPATVTIPEGNSAPPLSGSLIA
jgi:hypothetical protein